MLPVLLGTADEHANNGQRKKDDDNQFTNCRVFMVKGR